MAIQDIGLQRSVSRLLEADERAERVVFMSTRHRLWIPFVAGSAGAFVLLALVIGVDTSASRVGLGLVGGALAAMATTEYRALAETSEQLVLLRCSRVRRRATAVMKRFPRTTRIEPMASNLVTAEYRIENVVYSVLFRYRSEMEALVDR